MDEITSTSTSITVDGKTYPCAVSLTMALVGGKWKTVILYHLIVSGKRYSELKRELRFVTEMTLSLQLKQLEKDGLISRTVAGSKPPYFVTYALTNLGESFIPILKSIANWGGSIITAKEEKNKVK